MTSQIRGALASALKAVASLRLAVALMGALGIACAAATVYERNHGTAAAQAVFYQAPWFTALLVLLAVNILASLLLRYPWTRHQTGFVLAHTGILLLLLGSLVSLCAGLDGQIALPEGGSLDRITMQDGAVRVALPGGAPVEVRVPEETSRPRRVRLPFGTAVLVVDTVAPHSEVTETLQEGTVPNPALHYVMAGSFGSADGWLVATDPTESHTDFGPVEITLRAASLGAPSLAPPVRAAQNRLQFVAHRDGVVEYVLESLEAGVSSGRITPGVPIETPWMGMTFTVDRVLQRAAVVRTVIPADRPSGDERRPAVQLHIESAGEVTPALWLSWSETGHLHLGATHFDVGFGLAEKALPFRVTLLDFHAEMYPGSTRPATFESRVRVEDPRTGVSEHLISMNHPLHYDGYTFFQSSFVEGEPMTSILSVSRAPGLPLVYLGTLLVSLGIAWMVWLKPTLARWQGRRALATRRRHVAAAA